MIEIEFEPPSIELCECCGAETVTLTRSPAAIVSDPIMPAP